MNVKGNDPAFITTVALCNENGPADPNDKKQDPHPEVFTVMFGTETDICE